MLCEYTACKQGDGGTRRDAKAGRRFCCRDCCGRGMLPAAEAGKRRRKGPLAASGFNRESYSQGYQSARHKYHYRTWLRALAAALSAAVSGGQGPGDSR